MALPKMTIDAEILNNDQLNSDVYSLTVQADALVSQCLPGQFVHVQISEGSLLLRRPFGIADVDISNGRLTIFYRVAGKGTHILTGLESGKKINILGPLGHGFSLDAKRPLIIGGGMGLAPLLFLAKCFHGIADVLMGGRTQKELFWKELFKPHGHNLFIATDDGSIGEKGFTTDLLPEILKNNSYDCIYTCGPEIMMRGISRIAQQHNISCQVSLEKRMACGLGACLSCVCDNKTQGRSKICKDGPVFWSQDVFF